MTKLKIFDNIKYKYNERRKMYEKDNSVYSHLPHAFCADYDSFGFSDFGNC